MKLEDYVAVSSLPGVFKMAANRSNGLIVEDLDSGKKRFVSARKYQFTPLASIGIYTLTDTEELKVIFTSMLNQLADNPPVAPNRPAKDIIDYFGKILPDFDRDRVYVSDIKKVIKWFLFLNERNLLTIEEEAEAEEAETVAEDTTDTTEEESTLED